jgi:cold shock CspA family protein
VSIQQWVSESTRVRIVVLARQMAKFIPCWVKFEAEVESTADDAGPRSPSHRSPSGNAVVLCIRVPPPPPRHPASQARQNVVKLPPVPPPPPTRLQSRNVVKLVAASQVRWKFKRNSRETFRSESRSADGRPMFDPDKIRTGVIKMFHGKRSFGFITRDDGKKSIFFHAATFRSFHLRRYPVGAAVEFKEALNQRRKSLIADKLRYIDDVGSGSRPEACHGARRSRSTDSGGERSRRPESSREVRKATCLMSPESNHAVRRSTSPAPSNGRRRSSASREMSEWRESD